MTPEVLDRPKKTTTNKRIWTMIFAFCLFSSIICPSLAQLWPDESPVRLYVSGRDRLTGSQLTQIHLLGSDGGSINTQDFSSLCYRAIQSDPGKARLLWLEKCWLDPPATTWISIEDDEAEWHTISIRVADDRFSLPLANSSFDLDIFSNNQKETISTRSDEQAHFHIYTNIDDRISWQASSSWQDFEAKSDQQPLGDITLTLDCGLQKRETLAWNLADQTLTNEVEAARDGWQPINQLCDDDPKFPGYRYNHPSHPNLTVIFDENEELVGMQMGSDVAFYFAPHTQICGDKRSLCQPHRPYLVKEDSKTPIFHHLDDALLNGWRSLDTEEGLLHKDQMPCLTHYESGKLRSLITLQGQIDALASGGLRSSFYLGGRGESRRPPHDDIFYIKVKDQNGHPVQGATIKLRHGSQHQLRGGQLSTDHRGHAFLAFDRRLHQVSLDLEPPTERNLGQYLWRGFKGGYRLSRHHHRQTLVVETVKRAKVRVKVQDAELGSPTFFIWTNKKGHSWKRSLEDGKLRPFHVDLDVTEIYLLNYGGDRLTYRQIDVDAHRRVHGHYLHGLDIKIALHSWHHQSRLTIDGKQDKLSGPRIHIELGLPHRPPLALTFATQSLTLDVPRHLLLAWRVHAADHTAEVGSSVTPFKENVQLLKTIDIDIHVCLQDSQESSADKEASVEAILEYEWASQDDSREIIPVDYRGNVRLKRIPSPAPGESLNITLTSRLGEQLYYSHRQDYHKRFAHHSSAIQHDSPGQMAINFCHDSESVVVVVSDGVTGWRIFDAKVRLSSVTQITNEEGAAFFSLDDHRQKFHLQVWKEHYDTVSLSKYAHTPTDVIQIKLYPQKLVHVHVHLGHSDQAAVGAVIDWNGQDDDGGWEGTDGQGRAQLLLSGKSDKIHQLTAFLPWQSTCHHQVYGMSKLSGQKFPLDERPPFHADLHLTLPRLTNVDYQVDLQGLFPELATLHLLDSKVVANIEDSIRFGTAHLSVPVGTHQAFVHLQESYSSTVLVSSLEPCFQINRLEDRLMIKRKSTRKTVKTVVKMVGGGNVTLHYAVGLPTFDLVAVEPDRETGEVTFHLPEGLTVNLAPECPHRVLPHQSNPSHFRAQEGLVVVLSFGNHHQDHLKPVTVQLHGDGFHVPEGTLLKYVAKDANGEMEHRAMVTSDGGGKAEISVTLNTAYVDFAVGGSDGFDPMFFHPFDYVYNISDWHSLDRVDIPVKTWTNVIVAVRDCFSGDLIKSRVKFPAEALYPNSVFNRASLDTDDQGMAFFQLDPDIFIPMEVHSEGYDSVFRKISVASNTTHLAEINLCQKIMAEMRVMDGDKAVSRAVVSISLDNEEAFDVISDERGRATFEVTTAVKKVSLQLTNAEEGMKDPVFHLHDELGFLKEIDVTVLPYLHTIELATVSCHHLGHFPHVPVLFNIDERTEFTRASDGKGFIRLKVRQGTKSIVGKVLEHQHQHVITLVAQDSFGIRTQFQSFPIAVSLRLVDAYFNHRPVAHATISIGVGRENFELVTDREGQALIQVAQAEDKKLSVRLLEARSEVVEPEFELRDDCADSGMHLQVLERMFTSVFATADCHDFRQFSNVPVLVQISYQNHPHAHANVHREERKWIATSSDSEYVQTSDQEGNLRIRVPESAANVTLTVLESPPDARGKSLTLLPVEDLPDGFSFTLNSLPKRVPIRVRDSENEEALAGAIVSLRFYDPALDQHVSEEALADGQGQAIFEMDSCVASATVVVTPPSHRHYKESKLLHVNLEKDRILTIDLTKDGHKHLHLSIKTELEDIDHSTFTTALSTQRRDVEEPIFGRLHLKAQLKDERIHLLTGSSTNHVFGLTQIDLGCVEEHSLRLFRGSVRVTLKAEDKDGHLKRGARLQWHPGHGLGSYSIRTSYHSGEATLFVPLGYLMALEGQEDCHFHLQVHEARNDQIVTLTCK